MARRKTCMIYECTDPVVDGGLCDVHHHEWMGSREFVDAVDDKTVRGWFALGCKDRGMREIAKFRRRWAKRVNGNEESTA